MKFPSTLTFHCFTTSCEDARKDGQATKGSIYINMFGIIVAQEKRMPWTKNSVIQLNAQSFEL